MPQVGNCRSAMLLPLILEKLNVMNPDLAKRVSAFTGSCDSMFQDRAQDFFGRYENFLKSQGRSIEWGVECFVHLQHSVDEQREHFLRTGRYANTSFD